MPISMTEKQKIIQQLLATKTKAYQAEVKLLLKHKPEQANEVKTHGKELSRKIDRLIAQSISNWMEDAEIIIKDVKLTNTKIQRSINDIQNDVNLARNVVKIVGFIDEIVEIVDAIA
jgi:hypothetical protein